MTLANKITMLRILLIPVFVITYMMGIPYVAFAILAISAITDFLDGTVARRMKQKTPLGSFLDPMADKLLLTAVMLTFTLVGKLPLWFFVIILSRDLLVSLGWFLMFVITGAKEVHTRMLGKLTTASQMITALLVMVSLPAEVLHPIFIVTASVTAVSGLDYIIIESRTLK